MPLPFLELVTRLSLGESVALITEYGEFNAPLSSVQLSDFDRFDNVLNRCLYNRGRGDTMDSVNIMLEDPGEDWYAGMLKESSSKYWTCREVFELIETAYNADPMGFLNAHFGEARALQLLRTMYVETVACGLQKKLYAYARETPVDGAVAIYNPAGEVYWWPGNPNKQSRTDAQYADDRFYVSTPTGGYVHANDPVTTVSCGTTIEIEWNPVYSPNVVMFSVWPVSDRDVDLNFIHNSVDHPGFCTIQATGSLDFTRINVGDKIIVEDTTVAGYNRVHTVTFKFDDDNIDTDQPYTSNATGGTARKIGSPQFAENVVPDEQGLFNVDLTYDEVNQAPYIYEFVYFYAAAHTSGIRDRMMWISAGSVNPTWGVWDTTEGGVLFRLVDSLGFVVNQGIYEDEGGDWKITGTGIWTFDEHRDTLAEFNRLNYEYLAALRLAGSPAGDNIDGVSTVDSWALDRQCAGFSDLFYAGAIATAVEEDTATTFVIGFEVTGELAALTSDGRLVTSVETRVTTSPAITDDEKRAWLVNAYIQADFNDYLDVERDNIIASFPAAKVAAQFAFPRSQIFGPLYRPWQDTTTGPVGGEFLSGGPMRCGVGAGYLPFARAHADHAWIDIDAVEWYLPTGYDGDAATRRWRSLEAQWLSFQQIIRCWRGEMTITIFDAGDSRYGDLQNTDQMHDAYAQALCYRTLPSVVYDNKPKTGVVDTRFVNALREWNEGVTCRDGKPVPRGQNRIGYWFGSSILINTIDVEGGWCHVILFDPTATKTITQIGSSVVIAITAPYAQTITLANAVLVEPANRVSTAYYVRQTEVTSFRNEIALYDEPAAMDAYSEPQTFVAYDEPEALVEIVY